MKVLVTGENGQLGYELRSISDQFRHFNFTFTDSEDLDITNVGGVKVFFKQNSFDTVINYDKCVLYILV